MKACPNCSYEGAILAFCLGSYDIVRCERCGLEFNEKFFDGSTAGSIFDEHYYKDVQHSAFRDQFDNFDKDPSVRNFDKYLAIMEDRVRKGRILDVGSALGTFLKVAENRGWEPHGVEVSAFSADYARSHYGYEIVTGDVADASWADEYFDVITFWDTIEHVLAPRQAIEHARRMLKPDGVMLFTTDNFDCLVADLARLLYQMTKGRLRYPVERVFIKYNRSYFNAENFRTLITSAGLREVYFKRIEYPIEKINTNIAEWMVLRMIYLMQKITRRPAQFLMMATKA